MRKPAAVFSGAFLFLLLFSSRLFAWEIANYQNDVVVHENGITTVTETIEADFTGEMRHGLLRNIPINGRDNFGNKFTSRLNVLAVTDEAGNAWPYQMTKTGWYVILKIGDPDRMITGRRVYKITYDVERGAVRYFDDHEEFFWNLIGTEWEVPVRNNEARIEIPEKAGELRAVGYEGPYGAAQRVRQIKIEPHSVTIRSDYPLGPREGLTVAVKWNKGGVQRPSYQKQIMWWLQDNGFYGIPVIVFILMYGLWYQKGRDPKTGNSIAVIYEAPEGLTPAEVGALMDQKVEMRGITATVVDLAVRGFIRIEKLPKSNYELTSLKPWAQEKNLKPHEVSLLNEIFDQPKTAVKMSSLKNVFYTKISGLHGKILKNLMDAGLFEANPESVRNRYVALAIFVGLLLFFVPRFLLDESVYPSGPMVIGAMISCVIMFFFAFWMPKRTIKGAQVMDKTAGFSEFLKRADQDRIKRMNDPELFEKCLPFAMALGLESQWAHAFDGLAIPPPTWYVGYQGSGFSARHFTTDLNRMSSSLGAAFASQPSSSGSSGFGGGGFSGGGGGGGGGSAW